MLLKRKFFLHIFNLGRVNGSQTHLFRLLSTKRVFNNFVHDKAISLLELSVGFTRRELKGEWVSYQIDC